MSDPKWQDHHLTDIIEAQLLLFFHLSRALDDAGVLPRRVSAQALRETAQQNELRPGVRSCLRAIAELLERADRTDARPAWEPRVVPGGSDAGPNDTAGQEQGAGNGQAGNGSLPAGWRPRLVGDDDPDCA